MNDKTSWRIELDHSSRALGALLDQGVPRLGTSSWLDRMEDELRRVSSALVGFGAEVDDGLYDDVVAEAPRLAPAVGRLRHQQYELQQRIDTCLSTVSTGESDPESVEIEGAWEPHPNPIEVGKDPMVIIRPEGAWDEPGVLEHSSVRPATNPNKDEMPEEDWPAELDKQMKRLRGE